MDWICAVPWIAPRDNLDEFLADIEPELLPRFRFFDNSKGGDMAALRLEDKGVRVEYHPENLGVVRAWNIALREGHDQTIVCSTSVRFPEGFAAALRVIERHAVPDGFYSQLGWHLASVGRACVEKVGLWDENFYPCYFEDCDYGRRSTLAGIYGVPGATLWHHQTPAISSGFAKAAKTRIFVENRPALAMYYQRKWGGPYRGEVYTRPFNDPINQLGDWPAATVDELKERYGLL
jgi:GT2 family glycosyltransferase